MVSKIIDKGQVLSFPLSTKLTMLFSIYHYDYFFIMFGIFSFFITFFYFIFNFFYFVFRNYDIEKISIYECGFDPFEDTLGRFDIRFYLVSILFLIFDIEVIFLFPWALALSAVGHFGFLIAYIFLLLLTIGFLYEWFRGALEWA